MPYCMNHMGPEKCLQMHLSTAAGASQERIAEGECQAVDDGFEIHMVHYTEMIEMLFPMVLGHVMSRIQVANPTDGEILASPILSALLT